MLSDQVQNPTGQPSGSHSPEPVQSPSQPFLGAQALPLHLLHP